MPWKVTDKMESRKKFVLRVLGGDKLIDVCREFGITRKTGHKFLKRYKELGESGLADQSRRPIVCANELDELTISFLLKFKKEKPTWGAPKLREIFIQRCPNYRVPAISTIHSLLDRNGLVKHGRNKSIYRATGTYLSNPKNPNDLWCTDFKGQFKMRDESYCYPLTITDQVSRLLIAVEGMECIQEDAVMGVFREVFKEHGMPEGIRSDNGVPFASQSIWGLSKLSIWWLRLGIKLERIKPGNPQQNGRHERMHRTLKLSTTKPAGKNILAQQEIFNHFIEEYNTERPHEALAMKTPMQVHKKSIRKYSSILEEPGYESADLRARVSLCGSINMPNRKRVWIGMPFAGQTLGIEKVEDQLWRVDFMDYELGYFDEDSWKLAPSTNPFGTSSICDKKM